MPWHDLEGWGLELQIYLIDFSSLPSLLKYWIDQFANSLFNLQCSNTDGVWSLFPKWRGQKKPHSYIHYKILEKTVSHLSLRECLSDFFLLRQKTLKSSFAI